MNMTGLLSWFLSRLQEPSTWAGLGSLVVAAGYGSAGNSIVAAGAGIAGVLAVFLKEGK